MKKSDQVWLAMSLWFEALEEKSREAGRIDLDTPGVRYPVTKEESVKNCE